MDWFSRNWWKLWLLYILIWIFSGSWHYNRFESGFNAFIAGMIWPIYWMTKLALYLTKPW
jgi:hypothetical protein